MTQVKSNFYKELPVLTHFFESSNPGSYHSLPSDWYLALTDIVDSTGAIAENRYKSVNILGAAPIAGMLNIVDKNAIPYTFGGDGSMIAVPPDIYDDACSVLATCKKIGADAYNLTLRTALIPVASIYENKKELSVARFKVSDYYLQALFMGSGVRYAEQLLKDPKAARFKIDPTDGNANATFTGLECRWKEIKSPGKEVITLLVEKNSSHHDTRDTYPGVMKKLRDIYGFDDKTNPVFAEGLSMHKSVTGMMDEVRIRTFGKNWFQRLFYTFTIQVQSLIGNFFMKIGYKGPKRDWSHYKPDFVLNSDHRKFDNMLRAVISGTARQRKELESYLEQQHRQNKLAYGMHVTDAAVVTCMIFEYHHEHIHFVDGNNGGYVMAANALRKRMETIHSK